MSISEKLTTIAENQEKVYEAGKTKEWSDFWEKYQSLNLSQPYERTDYIMAFCGGGWNRMTFYPKYNMKVSNAERMFQFFGQYTGETFNLASRLKEINITIDYSNCTRFYYCFGGSFIDTLPTIDMTSATSASTNYSAFSSSFLHTVEKFIFSENTDLTGAFVSADKLKNINEIEGTIGKTVDLKSCLLTKASITNVVNALSGNVSGITCTFKKTAKEAAFTTDEWNTLIATKSNWTFSLV